MKAVTTVPGTPLAGETQSMLDGIVGDGAQRRLATALEADKLVHVHVRSLLEHERPRPRHAPDQIVGPAPLGVSQEMKTLYLPLMLRLTGAKGGPLISNWPLADGSSYTPRLQCSFCEQGHERPRREVRG